PQGYVRLCWRTGELQGLRRVSRNLVEFQVCYRCFLQHVPAVLVIPLGVWFELACVHPFQEPLGEFSESGNLGASKQAPFLVGFVDQDSLHFFGSRSELLSGRPSVPAAVIPEVVVPYFSALT